jgi:hypothetical protein
MSWSMSEEEFRAVQRLPARQRYSYALKRIADWEEIWSLGSTSGWVVAGDAEGVEHVPVWPHERFASACATDAWSAATPRLLAMWQWLEKWVPGLERDQRRIVVFPTPDDSGIVVTPERFREDLQQELDLLE